MRSERKAHRGLFTNTIAGNPRRSLSKVGGYRVRSGGLVKYSSKRADNKARGKPRGHGWVHIAEFGALYYFGKLSTLSTMGNFSTHRLLTSSEERDATSAFS